MEAYALQVPAGVAPAAQIDPSPARLVPDRFRLNGAAGATMALLFAWSLYYWNLLGWRL